MGARKLHIEMYHVKKQLFTLTQCNCHLFHPMVWQDPHRAEDVRIASSPSQVGNESAVDVCMYSHDKHVEWVAVPFRQH